MKKLLQNHRFQENLIYYLVWLIVFLSPVVLYYGWQTGGDRTFDWNEVITIWTQVLLPFFLLFVIHNHFVAPLWLRRGNFLLYLSIMMLLVGAFAVTQCMVPGIRDGHPDRIMNERGGPRGPMPPEFRNDSLPHMGPPNGDFGGPPQMGDEMHPGGNFRPGDGFRPDGMEPGRKPDGGPGIDLFLNEDFRHFMAVAVAVLMLGMNLFIKLLFRNAKREKEAMQLQQEHLRQQLAYLKYQISPHFFMNTLNNIHALIDIDTEEAKATVMQLSKLMRYVLYESDRDRVSLSHDLEFVRSYMALMKIRYTDNVRISVSIPDDLPDISVPPMLFINFVENAFKHGVSYQLPSYVEVSFRLYAEELHFSCANSRHPAAPGSQKRQSHGGVGIANTRQRLDLIFGKAYTLDIRETDDRYEVNLLFRVASQTS